jgi:hypothetical protein
MSSPTTNEAESFYQYLGAQLHLGVPSKSPEELVGQWREQQEYQETLAAVREGMADAEAGRMRSLRELLDEAGG